MSTDALEVDMLTSQRMLAFAALVCVILLGSAHAGTGYIQIRAEPEVHVYLDDVYVGVTSADFGGLVLMDVSTGRRHLRFEREGYVSQSSTIAVASGRVALHDVAAMVRQPQVTQMGTIVVRCLPIECWIAIPALNVQSWRSNLDQLEFEISPAGHYDVSLTFGDVVLSASFELCAGSTTTLFANFASQVPDLQVTTEPELGPACERVSVRLLPASTHVLAGASLPIDLELEGSDIDDIVWHVSAGEVHLHGDDVMLVAPHTPGEIRLRAESFGNPAWTDEVLVSVVPFVLDGMAVTPDSVTDGEEIEVSWVVTKAPVLADARVTCTVQVPGQEDVSIGDCDSASSVSMNVRGTGLVPVHLRVALDGIAVTASTWVAVMRSIEPTTVRVTNVQLGPNVARTRLVSLDVSWDESWRGPNRPTWVAAPDNWDAAWVFVKYRIDQGAWRHATLARSGHTTPHGAIVDVASDGTGAFVYRASPGYGSFNALGVELAWDVAMDNVPVDADVEVRPFAVAMVYVPPGPFSLGTGWRLTHTGEFRANDTSSSPFIVSSQGSLELGNETGQLSWWWVQGIELPTGGTLTHASFPTGYDGFYVMKHELTQGEYVNFLNTLTAEQARARMPPGPGVRFAVTGSAPGMYATSLPFVAMNYMSWADAAAFADWSALRPMTELEYEKAARGPLDPVRDEFAWGSSSIEGVRELVHAGTAQEAPALVSANAHQRGRGSDPNTASIIRGPIRVGSFAAPGLSRRDAGAGFYGALDLTGNVEEHTISVLTGEGRAFMGTHGDGMLDTDGLADVESWPGTSSVAHGLRGGGWPHQSFRVQVSYRNRSPIGAHERLSYVGWRGARTAP